MASAVPVQQPAVEAAPAVVVPVPVQAMPAPQHPVPAPAPTPAFRRNTDILLAFFAFATTIFAWAAAGTWWASNGPFTYYLTYGCGNNNNFCTTYVSQTPNAALANLQGACVCLIFSGLATFSICIISFVRLIAPGVVASAMNRMGVHPERGDLLTLVMGRAAIAAFILAMIGTTLPSVALYPQSLNGPGVALGIVNVIICAGLVFLSILQSCAPRVPAAAAAVAAIGSVDIKMPTIAMGGAQAPAAPPAQGVVYTAPVAQAAPVVQAAPVPAAAPAPAAV